MKAMKAKPRKPQDTTLRNVRAANKRIHDLEVEVTKITEVVVLMATWISETNPETFDKPLSRENAAQIIQKLK